MDDVPTRTLEDLQREQEQKLAAVVAHDEPPFKGRNSARDWFSIELSDGFQTITLQALSALSNKLPAHIAELILAGVPVDGTYYEIPANLIPLVRRLIARDRGTPSASAGSPLATTPPDPTPSLAQRPQPPLSPAPQVPVAKPKSISFAPPAHKESPMPKERTASPVEQLTNEGSVIREFPSAINAAKAFGAHQSAVFAAIKRHARCRGFFWRRKGDSWTPSPADIARKPGGRAPREVKATIKPSPKPSFKPIQASSPGTLTRDELQGLLTCLYADGVTPSVTEIAQTVVWFSTQIHQVAAILSGKAAVKLVQGQVKVELK